MPEIIQRKPASPDDHSSEPTSQTPPTQDPPGQSTEPDSDPALDMARQVIVENNRRIAELEARIAKGTEAPPPPPRSVQEQRDEFFNDPISVMRREMRETIAPLQALADRMQSSTVLDDLINQAKNSSTFASNWNQPLEDYVRQQAAQLNPGNLNANTLAFIITSGIGMQATGLIKRPQRTTEEPPVSTTPHYMRPSAPPAPRAADDRPKQRELNENEKRILREFNNKISDPKKKMTESQFVDWQTLPPASVASATFDREAK